MQHETIIYLTECPQFEGLESDTAQVVHRFAGQWEFADLLKTIVQDRDDIAEYDSNGNIHHRIFFWDLEWLLAALKHSSNMAAAEIGSYGNATSALLNEPWKNNAWVVFASANQVAA